MMTKEIEAEVKIYVATWSEAEPTMLNVLQSYDSEEHALAFLNRLEESGTGKIEESLKNNVKTKIWVWKDSPFHP